ncbi:MAG TPA: hypothetical protein VLA58_04620, partial [Chitinophagaceae bacterium]|nr:hypothetical protein [Chitinophagaceae bacterium]
MRSSTFLDSVPKSRCRGKDPSSKTPLWTFMTVFFLSMFLNLGVQAQLNTCNNCTAKDIKAIGLRADIGNQATCVAGNIEVDPDLYVDFEVTSAERYG